MVVHLVSPALVAAVEAVFVSAALLVVVVVSTVLFVARSRRSMSAVLVARARRPVLMMTTTSTSPTNTSSWCVGLAVAVVLDRAVGLLGAVLGLRGAEGSEAAWGLLWCLRWLQDFSGFLVIGHAVRCGWRS